MGQVHVVPLADGLRWNRHQNGDWPDDPRRNALCPLSPNQAGADESLVHHLEHAYSWIEDAITGTLTKPTQRYEFPHVRPSLRPLIYVDGGTAPHQAVKQAECGLAVCRQLPAPWRAMAPLHVVELHNERRRTVMRTEVRGGFGSEDSTRLIPWVFAGDPVVAQPHQPATCWGDLPTDVVSRAERAVGLLRQGARHEPEGLLLLAYEVPETWEGEPDRIVWQCVKVEDLEVTPKRPSRKGCRFRATWDSTSARLTRPLSYVGVTDVSAAALYSRHDRDLGGRRVGIVGAGALGSMFCKAVAKLGPHELVVVDGQLVEPGNLLRHEAGGLAVASPKASSGALSTLMPGVKARYHFGDVITDWNKVQSNLQNSDVVVDLTASVQAHAWLAKQLPDKPQAIGYLRPGPEFGLLLLRAGNSSVTLDDARAALRTDVPEETWRAFAAEVRDENLVWPEPGCYHPTFRAPFHRVRMMADLMVESARAWIADECERTVVLMYRQIGAPPYGMNTEVIAQVELP